MDPTNYIMNGVGYGPVGQVLNTVRFQPGLLRPYIDDNGVRCVTINTGRKVRDNKTGKDVPKYAKVRIRDLMDRDVYSPVWNTTTLRKDQWIRLDEMLQEERRKRLRAWADLAARNPYGGFDGMAFMTLEYEAVSDVGSAEVDMYGVSNAMTSDRPQYKLFSQPLPITHSDFFFMERDLAVSNNRGTSLTSRMAENAMRRCMETLEQTTIGTANGVTWGTEATGPHPHTGTSTVYGYINFPQRVTKTDLTVPTGSNPNATVDDILEMRDLMYANNYFGPYVIYHSTDWDEFLDNDYAFTNGTNWATNPNMTLRDRIKRIEGILDVRRLDYLTPAASHAFTLLMIQMESDVCDAVIGMDFRTVQWPSRGGMQTDFKVLGILSPRMKQTFSGTSGILHARTA